MDEIFDPICPVNGDRCNLSLIAPRTHFCELQPQRDFGLFSAKVDGILGFSSYIVVCNFLKNSVATY